MVVLGIDASRANAAQKTGTEWYSYMLIRSMTSLHRELRFRLYSKTPLEEGLRNLGDHVESRVLSWPPRRLWTQFRLSWEVAAHPPDVLFIPAHTLPLAHPRFTVTTIHDVGFARYPELYNRKELAYHRWSTRFALSHAQRIIVPSEFTKQEILSLYTVNPDRIVPIHHGFDPLMYRVLDDRSEIDVRRRRLGIRESYFFYVGRLQEKKNTPGLVEAFARFLRRGPTPRPQLVLAGQADYGFHRIQETINRYHIEDDVRILGYVDQGDVVSLMNGAIAFVFPSFYEGFGFPVLEAQACGVPVITSRRASLPEVGGEGAYYIDPTDVDALSHALEVVLHDQDLRSTLRQRGFVNLRRFPWERCAEKTLEVLLQCLS